MPIHIIISMLLFSQSIAADTFHLHNKGDSVNLVNIKKDNRTYNTNIDRSVHKETEILYETNNHYTTVVEQHKEDDFNPNILTDMLRENGMLQSGPDPDLQREIDLYEHQWMMDLYYLQ